jgi:hypothetical protein
MTLTQILAEAEYTLGWIPEGQDLPKAHRKMHAIMTRALAKRGYTVTDLELALRYCQRRRQPINHPAELLGMIPLVRELAAAPADEDVVRRRVAEAIVMEQRRADDDTTYWVGRLVNSQGEGRERTLAEWQMKRGQ